MFKFDFNLEEPEDDAEILNVSNETNVDTTSDINTAPLVSFNVSSVLDLIPSLPPGISYSPVKIPRISSSSDENPPITLFRRDLFDARLQLISEDDPPDGCDNNEDVDHSESLSFVNAPSDLVAGVYEGGLKTWECSVDLAGYLVSLDLDRTIIGSDEFSILEIGCGTAIPSLYCLKYLFNKPLSALTCRTVVHLQDYNYAVLKLVTLPNVILSWYASPASEAYRTTLPDDRGFQPHDMEKSARPGELELTNELIGAFKKSLADYRIEFRFINGSWQDTSSWISENQTKFNLILSSETVYRISSLPHLITLLQNSASSSSKSAVDVSPPLCLIAAKVVYFGVGGGVESFVKAVVDSGGCSETVFETKSGVARKIMKIIWR